MSLEALVAAVKGRNIIAFEYDGKPRSVEPHAVGITPKGIAVMRAFQSGGDSATSVRSWKLFTVDKIVDLITSDATFSEPRPGYVTGDRAMQSVLAELA